MQYISRFSRRKYFLDHCDRDTEFLLGTTPQALINPSLPRHPSCLGLILQSSTAVLEKKIVDTGKYF